MYPEDRVLVAYVPSPLDFSIIQKDGWYRIPQKSVPKGLFAEYFAFYFGSRFGQEKWAIHYYAAQVGHELVTRRELFPQESDHVRADELYYKVQFGPLQRLDRPIISLRWRRLTFLHTTWDRFQDATELNDLFVDGGEYVDRLYAALRERGLHVQRNYQIKEGAEDYLVPLIVFRENGRIPIYPNQLPQSDSDLSRLIKQIESEINEQDNGNL
jgi:hypothetical protein